MAISERQKIIQQMVAARDDAVTLLRNLMDAKAQSERHLAQANQRDPLKQVTGRSSMENAISSTQRMIDTMNRSIASIRGELTESDLALLDEPIARRA